MIQERTIFPNKQSHFITGKERKGEIKDLGSFHYMEGMAGCYQQLEANTKSDQLY